MAWGVGACACAAGEVGAPGPRSAPVALRRVEAPTVPVERAALSALPGTQTDRVELGVAFPDALDPKRPHPILVTQVTADPFRPNVDELSAYAPTALEQGYVVLTAQAIPWPESPKHDTLMHRYATLRAALRWLQSEVPESESWPIVLAGFSGGAKIIQALAVSLTLEGRRVAGLFLGGCNEAHFRVLLAEHPEVKESFSRIAVYLSAGQQDRIAPPAAVRSVGESLRGEGVQHVELSLHPGEHRLDVQDLSRALGWFRTQIGPEPASGASAR